MQVGGYGVAVYRNAQKTVLFNIGSIGIGKFNRYVGVGKVSNDIVVGKRHAGILNSGNIHLYQSFNLEGGCITNCSHGQNRGGI